MAPSAQPLFHGPFAMKRTTRDRFTVRFVARFSEPLRRL